MTIVCPDPQLRWGEDQLLFNTGSQDTYYSKSGGLAETVTVFLDACGLPDRWEGRRQFVIGELGFGTGLNFLATWKLWKRHRRSHQILHYISVEHQPLDAETIARANAQWPELERYLGKLLSRLPPRHYGFHRLGWPEDGVWLTLCYAEAEAALKQFSAPCDAWFLDGFAPSRNPDMWSSSLMTLVAKQSSPRARVGTYSSAGAVKRALQAAGFHMKKVAGFGAKRERLVGELIQLSDATPEQPWFGSEHVRLTPPRSVTVVGAGIAGRCVARELAARGVETTLVSDGRSGGSQVPAAIVKPRLTADRTPAAELQWLAFLYAHRFYTSLDLPGSETGALDLVEDQAAEERVHKLLSQWGMDEEWMQWVTSSQASRIAGVPLRSPGLFQPRALTLDSESVLQALWTAENVLAGELADLRHNEDGWELVDEDGGQLGKSEVVVMACGVGSLKMPLSASLPLRVLKGQLSGVTTPRLNCVVAQNGFVTPTVAGRSWVGATYDHIKPSRWHTVALPDEGAHHRNLARASAFLDLNMDNPDGFAGLRAITPDHLPVAGPAPRWDAVERAYARVHHGEHWRSYPACPVQKDCYWLTGMGSRGYLFAPVLAEHLADQICGGPSPLAASHADLVHPVRFALRELKRHGTLSSRSP